MYSVMKFQAPFERIKQYNDSSQVSLYKAIITQAIIDATNVSEDKIAKGLEKEAKNWLFGNSEYFKEVCYCAEMEPSFVVKIAKEAIKLNREKNSKIKNVKQRKNSQKNIVKKFEVRYASSR